MTSEALLQKFDALADAPNGVQRLREMILTLAFRGKLTAEFRPNGESQIPDGWTVASVGSLSREIVSGFACNKKNEDPNGYVHLRTHNVGVDGRLNFDLIVRVARDKVHPNRAELRAGDVIFNNTNSQELVGKTCLVDQDYSYGFSNHLTRIRLKPTVVPAYFVYYFNYLLRVGYFAEICNRWIGQAGINTKMLREIEVPIASLDEQHRIVERVDQLMALCDELEERQRRRTEKRISAIRSSLHNLTTAADNEDLAVHWRRIREHFDILFDAPETVAELRQAVLQLAVRGKLVPQDPSDEPASELMKSGTDLHARDQWDKERDFPVPPGWLWVRLDEIADLQIGRTPSTRQPSYWADDKGGFPWVSISDMPPIGIIKETARCVSKRAADDVFKRPPASAGTLLMSFKLTIGKVAILEEAAYFNEAIVAISPAVPEVRDYLVHCLRGINLLGETNAAIKGSTLNSSTLKRLAIPLPPLAEQRRIVERVDQLMALCDELETTHMHSRAKAEHLAASVVHHISAA